MDPAINDMGERYALIGEAMTRAAAMDAPQLRALVEIIRQYDHADPFAVPCLRLLTPGANLPQTRQPLLPFPPGS